MSSAPVRRVATTAALRVAKALGWGMLIYETVDSIRPLFKKISAEGISSTASFLAEAAIMTESLVDEIVDRIVPGLTEIIRDNDPDEIIAYSSVKFEGDETDRQAFLASPAVGVNFIGDMKNIGRGKVNSKLAVRSDILNSANGLDALQRIGEIVSVAQASGVLNNNVARADHLFGVSDAIPASALRGFEPVSSNVILSGEDVLDVAIETKDLAVLAALATHYRLGPEIMGTEYVKTMMYIASVLKNEHEDFIAQSYPSLSDEVKHRKLCQLAEHLYPVIGDFI